MRSVITVRSVPHAHFGVFVKLSTPPPAMGLFGAVLCVGVGRGVSAASYSGGVWAWGVPVRDWAVCGAPP